MIPLTPRCASALPMGCVYYPMEHLTITGEHQGHIYQVMGLQISLHEGSQEKLCNKQPASMYYDSSLKFFKEHIDLYRNVHSNGQIYTVYGSL